ncbi:MAG: hypothetical protein HGA44_18610 [Cellulomonadaceae bacterium]|nr:hypothetical protein [Cellulomonadaceae bacterium]
MSGELNDLLSALSGDVEAAAPTLGERRLQLLTSTVRRRRRTRRTVESFAGVAAVSALGVGLWFGTSQHGPAPVTPVTTPTPSPTADATPGPTTTPTPTESATPPAGSPPTRESAVDDATVLERLQHPRTGEVWQAPEPAPEVAAELDDGSGATFFRVGTRGGSAIYVGVQPDYAGVLATVGGLYEIDAAGARLIACPSARTGDPCLRSGYELPSTVVEDDQTFYDTLTLPTTIDLGDGWRFTTTSTQGSAMFPYERYGDGSALLGERAVDQQVLRSLGALDLVSETAPSDITGLTDVRYGIRTPFGSTIYLDPDDVPGGTFGAIRWDAGLEPTPSGAGVLATAPGSGVCFARTFSEESQHVPADWRPAGTTGTGVRVYVPAAGGTALSQQVRAWQSDNSWGLEDLTGAQLNGADAGYPFPTDAEFLAAHALYALQGPSGEWLLGLRGDAVQVVYECA